MEKNMKERQEQTLDRCRSKGENEASILVFQISLFASFKHSSFWQSSVCNYLSLCWASSLFQFSILQEITYVYNPFCWRFKPTIKFFSEVNDYSIVLAEHVPILTNWPMRKCQIQFCLKPNKQPIILSPGSLFGLSVVKSI